MGIRNNKVSILGCGWYGLAVARELITEGYLVKGSTTSKEKIPVLAQAGISPFLVNFQENETTFDPGFFDSDVLIISIPPKRSAAEQHSYLTKIKKISEAAVTAQLRQVILISSTSVYGDTNGEVDEDSIPAPDTASGEAILNAENLLKEVSAFTTTIIRFGGLIGPDRNPGRFFAGKTDIANGRAPVNLIHLSDCIGITKSIIDRQAYGSIYNACATDHPSRAEFYTLAAEQSGYEKPVFIDELTSWKLVKSKTISPLLDYKFKITLHSLVSQ